MFEFYEQRKWETRGSRPNVYEKSRTEALGLDRNGILLRLVLVLLLLLGWCGCLLRSN